PTHSDPSAHAMPESPPPPGAGIVASTLPVSGSILWMFDSAIWYRYLPSQAVPACAATWMARPALPLTGSTDCSLSPVAIQTRSPSKVTPPILVMSSKGPYSRMTSADDFFMGSSYSPDH